jgi:hypothetical protein
MFTDEDKKTAEALCTNKNFILLIKKVMLEREEVFNEQLLTLKTNAELGEMIRADIQAEIKIKNRLTTLLNLGLPKGKSKPVPR